MKKTFLTLQMLLILMLASCSQDDTKITTENEAQATALVYSDINSYTDRWSEIESLSIFNGTIKNLAPNNLTLGYTFDRSVFSNILDHSPKSNIYFGLGIDDQNSFVVIPKASQSSYLDTNSKTNKIPDFQIIKNSFDHTKALTISEDVYADTYALHDITKKHIITPADASHLITKWNTAFQTNHSTDLTSLITINGERLRGFTLEREAMEDMLSSKKLAKITIFLAVKEDQNLMTLILVGEDANGNRLFPDDSKMNNGEAGNIMLEYISPCPATC